MNITFVCITLEESADRRKSIRVIFEKLGILDKVIFWQVNRHPGGGIFGCFESHYNVWTTKEIRTKYVCVFEDDLSYFSTEKESCKRFHKLLNFIEEGNYPDCDFINVEPGSGYYDHNEDESVFFSKNSMNEIRSGYTTRTGCYIGEKSKLEQLAKKIKPYYGIDIDIALYGIVNMYSLVVPIFRQDKSFETTNNGSYHDYMSYTTNFGIDSSRTILTYCPLFAYLYLNTFQSSLLLYKSMDKKLIDKLKDRRIIKSVE